MTNVIKYKGREIVVSNNGEFCWDSQRCDRLADAKKIIDGIDEQERALVRKQNKLALGILDEKGNKYTVTGINAGTCRLITKPPLAPEPSRYGGATYYRGELYAAAPGVQEAIKRVDELRAEIESITKASIEPHRMTLFLHGAGRSGAAFADAIESLKKEHAKAMAGKRK